MTKYLGYKGMTEDVRSFYRAMYEAGAISHNEYNRITGMIANNKPVLDVLHVMADIGRYKTGRASNETN